MFSENTPGRSGYKTIHAATSKPTISRRRVIISGASVLVTGASVGWGALTLDGSKKVAEAPDGVANAAVELRFGYFGNVTHAPALVGLQRGFFAKELGTTKLSTQVFNAGPAVVEALNAGSIDAAYVGPSPTINSFVRSKNDSIRVIAGAALGGAQLVVRAGIDSAADLRGTVLASPQLGGTQDVALRSWLTKQGLKTSIAGGGDVIINPTENAVTLKLFEGARLDGAWLPEPWASRLVLQAGAKVLVDEKDLWDNGKFTTTVLIVHRDFLLKYPDTVERLLKGHLDAVAWLTDNSSDLAKETSVINAGLEQAVGKPLSPDVVQRALKSLEFTLDPLSSSWKKLLRDGVQSGLAKDGDLNGIFDLTPLNSLLRRAGKPLASASGLGKD